MFSLVLLLTEKLGPSSQNLANVSDLNLAIHLRGKYPRVTDCKGETIKLLSGAVEDCGEECLSPESWSLPQ